MPPHRLLTTLRRSVAVIAAFGALQTIPGIVAFETGVNDSPENLNKGLTHSFVVTFAAAADRDAYLPHPDHQKFVADWVMKTIPGSDLPYVKDVCVFDYAL